MNLATRAAQIAERAPSATQGTNGPQTGAQGRIAALQPQPDSDFTGVAVMLLPQDDDAAGIAPHAAIPADDLHCTLVYLGDADDLEALGYTGQGISDALRQVAAGHTPIEGTLGGLTRFSAPGDTDPVVLNVDSRGVHKVRQAVLDVLAKHGLKEASEHGYTAHLTLGYLPTDADLPQQRWSPLPVIFDRLRIGFRGERFDLPLDTFDMKSQWMIPAADLLVVRAKHLPGLHDQSTHGRGAGSVLKLIEEFSNRIEYEVEDDFISNVVSDAKIKFRQGKGDVSHKIWVVGRANPDTYLSDAANIMWQNPGGKVEGILVADPWQRQGLATRLWELATELAEQQGIDKPKHSDTQLADGAAWAASLGEKDVYGGMVSRTVSAGVGTRTSTPMTLPRKKRGSLRARATALLVRNDTQVRGIKSLAAFIETKGVRKVRTQGGVRHFGQPIGSIIVRDGEPPLEYIFDIGGSSYSGFDTVGDHYGRTYEVGPDPEDGGWVAVGSEGIWDDIVVQEARNEEEVYRLLNDAVYEDREPGTPPVTGTLKQKPVKAPAKKPTAKKPAAKKPATRIPQSAKKPAAKKPARTTAKGPKKTPALKVWQRPWKNLTAEEKKKLLDMRGQVPQANPLTKKPWTLVEVKRKREGRTAAAVLARAKKNGWRVVTSDEERHQLGIDSGKPIPPGWSHVLVYEGKDKDKRKYVIQGLDWAYKLQPHQTAAQRNMSLDNKFKRYRKLIKKLPALQRATKRDLATNDVAVVVRLMMLSGGRVDTSDGKNVTGSRGITSLLVSDVTIKGNKVLLQFDAKSGHQNDYQIVDADLAARLKNMMKGKKAGEQVFPDVDSTDTGAYIKKHAGAEFTNHDLRTAVANAAASKAIQQWLQQNPDGLDLDDPKAVAAAIKHVKEVVGIAINDTPTTAYNSYIDPMVFTMLGIPLDMLPARGAK